MQSSKEKQEEIRKPSSVINEKKEENNTMGKTSDLFKKIRDTRRISHAKMGTIKDRNSMDQTEAEDKKKWQEYAELHKKDLQFSAFQSFNHVILFATPWTAARQASLSITNSRSPPKPGLFKWVSSSPQVATVLQSQLQHRPFQCQRREEGWRRESRKALALRRPCCRCSVLDFSAALGLPRAARALLPRVGSL